TFDLGRAGRAPESPLRWRGTREVAVAIFIHFEDAKVLCCINLSNSGVAEDEDTECAEAQAIRLYAYRPTDSRGHHCYLGGDCGAEFPGGAGAVEGVTDACRPANDGDRA